MRRPHLISLCLALAGCGFHPVHSQSYRDSLSVDLSQMSVEVDNTRYGQLLKADIIHNVNPTLEHAEKAYIVRIKLTETEIPLFINPDGTSSRGDVQYNSTYTITRLIDNKVLTTGTLQSISSYNTQEGQDYASYVAMEDAKKRGVEELAQTYELRLSNLLPVLNNQVVLPKPPAPDPTDHHSLYDFVK